MDYSQARSMADTATTNGAPQRENSHDLVDQIYNQMLLLLQRQGLLAVETVNVANIAKELGVSRTPVNMALIRLERDRIVRRLPGGGWVTVALSRKDLDEFFELRRLLDALAMRKATDRATPDDLQELFRIVEEMEEAAQTSDINRWLALDHRYERDILKMADNERLAQVREQLRGQLLRMIMSTLLLSDRMLVSTREHRAMTETIATHDADLAVQQGLEHLASMEASLRDLFDKVLQPLRRLGK